MKVMVEESPKKYFCAICNTSYDSVEERSECESKCIKEREKAEEAYRKAKYNEEKKASEAKIEEALREVDDMISEHITKYKYLMLSQNYPCLKYIFKNSLGWWL